MSEVPMMAGMTLAEIAEHLRDICPEYGDLNAEEQTAFHSMENDRQQGIITSLDSGETSNSSLALSHENEASHGASIERQLAFDEAYARALELGDDFNNLYIHEQDVTAVETTDSISRGTATRGESHNIRQDDIDPDQMTYEELQSLQESVGTESRGLSADLISRLPTFKYKARFFSKKKKRENAECVICYSNYKNGDTLTTLPCAHQFHLRCITPWFHQKKRCPICQKEVLYIMKLNTVFKSKTCEGIQLQSCVVPFSVRFHSLFVCRNCVMLLLHSLCPFLSLLVHFCKINRMLNEFGIFNSMNNLCIAALANNIQ